MERERRFQGRENINVPILYEKDRQDSYHQAIMYNVSMDGMYFESNQMFSQGEYFFIKLKDPLPGFESVKPYDACAAQVKWCKKTKTDPSYKVGVKRLLKAEIFKKEAVETPTLCCELCANTSMQEVVKTDEQLYLCRNCFTYLSQLHGKTLKANINRFMVGNVI